MAAPRDVPQIPHPTTRSHQIQILGITAATSGPLRAFVDVQIGASLIIYGVKVIQQVGQSPWVGMPSREFTGADGTRKFSPILKLMGTLKADLEAAVLEAWKAEASDDEIRGDRGV
jgi:DNA-binding cell septation regulator SpoVG